MDGHRDVPTLSAHLALTLRASVDDVGGNVAARGASVVAALEVVVVDVPLEVAVEPDESDAQVAAKAGRQHSSRISLCNASTALSSAPGS
jgi:hypothetical protein